MSAAPRPDVEPPARRRLITAQEAATLLGCSWRTIYRYADSGKIPFGVRLGGLRRWDAGELDAFIAGGCRPIREPKGRRA